MEAEKEKYDRKAGILMHITSLPGPPFIGDIGPSAHAFANFLHEAGQSVWQLLPLQPIEGNQGYSPYSSSSAMAGNILLISPEYLVRDGWLDPGDLLQEASDGDHTAYDEAVTYKTSLLEKAYATWQSKADEQAKTAFQQFCTDEAGWLDDFALYTVVKRNHNNLPWYEWPDNIKHRDPAALDELRQRFAEETTRVKWQQMIFDWQWHQLKHHCTSLNIELIGDVPIYVAHDSADVWSHRELFTVDANGSLTAVAGVPPDLFNDDGQLWGMPLYNWELIKERGYDWWTNRIRKNLAWFDRLRLDHFRGFSSYWSVPAGSPTAKNGQWIEGPGIDIFHHFRDALGGLPFIAEDLGEIDEPVYILRDAAGLPGMNVLQFAFSGNMAQSPYIPHHHLRRSVVYTGTHDNDTAVGWFQQLDPATKKNLAKYTGTRLTDKNISDVLCRMAYMSVAELAILPIQDALGLDGSARMNMPASAEGNWSWRLQSDQLTVGISRKLKQWAVRYDRH